MVTRNNLNVMGSNLFLTRLPFSYNEANRVVGEAISEDNWEEVGTLNETPTTAKRSATIYRVTERNVQLYEQEYRAIVVHSSAHDKRRTKRIEREIKSSEKKLLKTIAEEAKQEFYCRADAEAAVSRLCESETELHSIIASIEFCVVFLRNRVPGGRELFEKFVS